MSEILNYVERLVPLRHESCRMTQRLRVKAMDTKILFCTEAFDVWYKTICMLILH